MLFDPGATPPCGAVLPGARDSPPTPLGGCPAAHGTFSRLS
jgi:hypothetical protein